MNELKSDLVLMKTSIKIKAETLYIEMHKDSGDLSQSQYTDQMSQLFIK